MDFNDKDIKKAIIKMIKVKNKWRNGLSTEL